jgi:hypothetical protein
VFSTAHSGAKSGKQQTKSPTLCQVGPVRDTSPPCLSSHCDISASQNCHARPVYVQNGFGQSLLFFHALSPWSPAKLSPNKYIAHPFCGQRCAAAFRRDPQAIAHSESQNENQEETPQNPSSSATAETIASPISKISSSHTHCILNGCKKKAYVEDGVPTRFCSQPHRR